MCMSAIKTIQLLQFLLSIAFFVFYSLILYLTSAKSAVLLSLTVISPPLSDSASISLMVLQ